MVNNKKEKLEDNKFYKEYCNNKDIPIIEKGSATKYDQGKLRYDLIPVYPLKVLAEVYTMGCLKYDDDNWRKGFGWRRLAGAFMRHFFAWLSGEDYNIEKFVGKDGKEYTFKIHHLGHCIWYLFTWLEFTIIHPELDDRIKYVNCNEEKTNE